MKRISRASPMAVRIQMNCLPLRVEKSRIEVVSEEWIDA